MGRRSSALLLGALPAPLGARTSPMALYASGGSLMTTTKAVGGHQLANGRCGGDEDLAGRHQAHFERVTGRRYKRVIWRRALWPSEIGCANRWVNASAVLTTSTSPSSGSPALTSVMRNGIQAFSLIRVLKPASTTKLTTASGWRAGCARKGEGTVTPMRMQVSAYRTIGRALFITAGWIIEFAAWGVLGIAPTGEYTLFGRIHVRSRFGSMPPSDSPATPDDGAAIIWPGANSGAVAQSLFSRSS